MDLVWFGIAAGTAALSPILIKWYTETGSFSYILLALLSYLILIISYVKVLSNQKISTIYPLLKVVSILLVVGTGLLMFGEKLTYLQILGVILGIIAILLLSN